MSLRETMNKSPALVALVVIVALAACGWMVWSQMRGSGAASAPNSAYFTTDEGKTLFSAPAGTLAPFDKDGQQAVKAYVYRCKDGTQKVAYLERFTEKGKAVTEKYRAEQKAKPGVPPASVGELVALGRTATEVKRPGDGKWLNAATNAAMNFIAEVKCADGEAPAQVNP